MNIGFIGDYFVQWVGGANFLAAITKPIIENQKKSGVQVHLLLNMGFLAPSHHHLVNEHLLIPCSQFKAAGPLGALIENLPNDFQICFYKNLVETIRSLRIDIIGPNGNDMGANFTVPWCGYIPDFQHQYLTDYFSQQERFQRDMQLRAVLENSSALFVNSYSVIEDLHRFYPGESAKKRIYKLPMIFPNINKPAGNHVQQALEKYKISQPYLISCSQRWVHKQHDFIVRAFANYVKKNPKNPLNLVFTGALNDYRSANHCKDVENIIQEYGLNNRIIQTGLIERDDQLALIAGSQAIVQASHFEGGPGASGTVEAALLEVPILASDIKPNRELAIGKILFFSPTREIELEKQIHQIVEIKQKSSCKTFTPDQITCLDHAFALQVIAFLQSIAF